MRNMSENKRSIVRMMNELGTHDQINALPRPVPSMPFVNQFCNRFAHPQLNEQENRARFFYQQRQKRKQRRLKQGPLAIQHYEQRLAVPAETNTGRKHITAIIGSSIARNISVQNIENDNHEVRLRYKSGSDCAEALSWLTSNEGRIFMNNVDQLIFILGTNDLHRVAAAETVQRIEHTIESVRYLYPRVNVIWQLLQQRTRKTWLLPEGPLVIKEINLCNQYLSELATKKHFDTIQPGIPIECMYDGLHPSMYGVHLMEATIRNYLKQKQMSYPLQSLNIPSVMSIQF